MILENKFKSLTTPQLISYILTGDYDDSLLLAFIERALARANGLNGLGNISAFVQEQMPEAASKERLLALCELVRRSDEPLRPHIIQRIEDALPHILDMGHLPHEEMRVILLDGGRQLIAISTVYKGTAYATVVRTAEIYREALLYNSPSIILAHNHPSGDPSPSPEDVEFTRALVAAGHLLDIQLIDHIIIGGKKWRSLKQLGLGFGVNR